MKKKKKLQTLATSLVLTSSILVGCKGVDNGPQPIDPAAGLAQRTRNAKLPADARKIDAAIGIYLTSAGQQYLYSNTRLLVENALTDMRNDDIREARARGQRPPSEVFTTTQGSYPRFKYEAKKPYTEAAMRQMLAGRTGDAQAARIAAAFESAQKAIKQWLDGFELKDPRFRVTVNGSNYSIKYNRFGVRVDSELAARQGIRNGTVLVAEVEIPSLQVKVPKVHLVDLNNDWLGTFGLENIQASFNNASKPLRIQFPIAVTLSSRDGIQVKALPAVTNIDKVAIVVNNPKLIFPPVSIVINGQESPLDTAPLEAEINKQKDDLVRGVQAWAKAYATEDAPDLIQAQIDPILKDYAHGYVGHMDAIMAPNDQTGKLVMGFEPAEIKNVGGNLVIEASAAIEDPIHARSPELAYPPVTRDVPALNATTAHAAVALSSATINRLLQLSFMRGYFHQIDAGGEKIKLLSTPRMVFDGSKGPNKAVLKVDARSKAPTTLGVTDGYVHFYFDLVIRFDVTSTGIKLVKDSIDLASLRVSDESINWLGGKVRATVLEKLTSADRDYRTTTSLLTDDPLPVPADIMGIPLKLGQLRVAAGYLTVLANLGAIPVERPIQ